MKNPFIFKVLDIGTGHMTLQDCWRLKEHLEDLSAYELSKYGWLCYVGEIKDNWHDDRWSEAFRNVLKQAAELGCDYVRFDRDGRVYDDLPSFDW